VIFNDGLPLDQLQGQVRALWQHWAAAPAGLAARL